MNDLKVLRDFPAEFIFGTATSSDQIEGSMYGGYDLSHWDTFDKKENASFEGQDGSRACEHIFRWYDNEWGFSNRMLDIAEHLYTSKLFQA